MNAKSDWFVYDFALRNKKEKECIESKTRRFIPTQKTDFVSIRRKVRLRTSLSIPKTSTVEIDGDASITKQPLVVGSCIVNCEVSNTY